MAVHLVATLIAEGASVDQLTGRLTVFNMLDRLFVAKFPSAAKVVIVTVYEHDGKPEPFWERVSISDPDEKQIFGNTLETKWPAARDRVAQNIGLLRGLPLPKEGCYTIRVENAPRAEGPWQKVCERRFDTAVGVHPLEGNKGGLRDH